jgi:hypothetical protein
VFQEHSAASPEHSAIFQERSVAFQERSGVLRPGSPPGHQCPGSSYCTSARRGSVPDCGNTRRSRGRGTGPSPSARSRYLQAFGAGRLYIGGNDGEAQTEEFPFQDLAARDSL